MTPCECCVRGEALRGDGGEEKKGKAYLCGSLDVLQVAGNETGLLLVGV
jgi:hypothetical protein